MINLQVAYLDMGDSEDDEVCVACGDGADSADELQKIIEEKNEE